MADRRIKLVAVCIILIITLCSQFCFAYSGTAIIKEATKYTTVRELTNHNDGVMIERFLKYTGTQKGLAWCLAFDVYVWGQVYPKNPFPKVAGTIYFWEYIKAHPKKYKIITTADLKNYRGFMAVGGIAIYHYNGGKTGHAVLFAGQLDETHFMAIAGNTVGIDTDNIMEQRGEVIGKDLLKVINSHKQGVYYRIQSSESTAHVKFMGVAIPIEKRKKK